MPPGCIERISRDGRVETKTELELLVNVLDKARWAPQSLVRFALDAGQGRQSSTAPARCARQDSLRRAL